MKCIPHSVRCYTTFSVGVWLTATSHPITQSLVANTDDKLTSKKILQDDSDTSDSEEQDKISILTHKSTVSLHTRAFANRSLKPIRFHGSRPLNVYRSLSYFDTEDCPAILSMVEKVKKKEKEQKMQMNHDRKLLPMRSHHEQSPQLNVNINSGNVYMK